MNELQPLNIQNSFQLIKTFPVIIFVLLFFLSCSKDMPTMEQETFNDADRPFFRYNGASNYFYCEPWNYDKEFNQSRKYPLLIYLHGWGGSGMLGGLGYLGYDTNDGNDDIRAKKFQATYPSFVLIPQTDESAWDSQELIELTENFRKQYRIDSNRIYLIGYSMGGSGSYIFINGYHDYNRHLFAGVIRLAGQSQVEVRDEIAVRTAIWLHIGLDDVPVRVDITREAYNFLKSKNPDTIEQTTDVNINGTIGTTVSLIKDGKEKVKKTEYNNTGHGIEIFPFYDDSLIKWLFDQEL